MSSVTLDSHALEFVQPSECADIEMSDRVETNQSNIGLVEIQLTNSHKLFAQMESIEYNRRVGVITSFLSLMEIAPAKALYLIREASNDSGSQEFRDYILFKQIFSDMMRCRESRRDSVQRRSRTSSSNQKSVIGPNAKQLSLQWMFAFFSMYAVPFHHKNIDDGENTILYAREKSDNGTGSISTVVFVQQDNQLSDSIRAILNEFDTRQTNTRMGIIVNGSALTILFFDNDPSSKTIQTVSVAQKTFDMTNVSQFAELVTVMEGYLAEYQNVDTVVKLLEKQRQSSDDIDVTVTQDEDAMESSPVPRTYPSFDELDPIYVDKFNTTLVYFYFNSYGSFPSSQFCVKKRSHFCNWERNVLQKLKTHPYIIRELLLEDEGDLDMNTTMFLEPARPLNKRLFSLLPTDSKGEVMMITQQILNTRFEVLRQFIKQSLHSIIYCHNNKIAHNNILSRGETFFLDEQYRLKLMGFEHAVVNCDSQLMFRDMKHLAVVFAELMFNVQFDVTGDDDLTDWSSIWEQIQQQIDLHEDIIKNCVRVSPNDQLLYKVNMKTKKHMFDLLKKMFHTNHDEYYHDYMYHSFVGMASSVYKEKTKQKLKEKTVLMLQGNRITKQLQVKVNCMVREKWANLKSSSNATVTVQE